MRDVISLLVINTAVNRLTTCKAMLWLLTAVTIAAFCYMSVVRRVDRVQLRFQSSSEDNDVAFSVFTVTNRSSDLQVVAYKIFVREAVGWRWTGVQAGGDGLNPSPTHLQLHARESVDIDVPVFEREHQWRLRLSYVRPTGLARRRMALALKLRKSMPRLSAVIQPRKPTFETIHTWGPEMHFNRPAMRPVVKEKLSTW